MSVLTTLRLRAACCMVCFCSADILHTLTAGPPVWDAAATTAVPLLTASCLRIAACACAVLTSLTLLQLDHLGQAVDDDAAVAIAKCLTGLRHLELPGNDIEDEKAIAALQDMPLLTYLQLETDEDEEDSDEGQGHAHSDLLGGLLLSCCMSGLSQELGMSALSISGCHRKLLVAAGAVVTGKTSSRMTVQQPGCWTVQCLRCTRYVMWEPKCCCVCCWICLCCADSWDDEPPTDAGVDIENEIAEEVSD